MAAEDAQRVEEHSTRKDSLAGWNVGITTYRIGDTYHCHVDNVSPGATVARAQAATREEAEKVAIERATARLAETKKHPT